MFALGKSSLRFPSKFLFNFLASLRERNVLATAMQMIIITGRMAAPLLGERQFHPQASFFFLRRAAVKVNARRVKSNCKNALSLWNVVTFHPVSFRLDYGKTRKKLKVCNLSLM